MPKPGMTLHYLRLDRICPEPVQLRRRHGASWKHRGVGVDMANVHLSHAQGRYNDGASTMLHTVRTIAFFSPTPGRSLSSSFYIHIKSRNYKSS